MVFGLRSGKVFVHGLDHGGIVLLGTQAVTAADDLNVGPAGFSKRGNNILVKGLTQSTGLLGAVEHGNALDALGNGSKQPVSRERTIQAYLDKAQFCALLVQVRNGFFGDFRTAAHHDDDVLRVGRADVVEQLVAAAGDLCDFAHVVLYEFGKGVVVFVGGFAALEVNVRVLCGAGLMRVLGVERTGAERLYGFGIEKFPHVGIVDGIDFLHFVGSTEAVKEMHERNAALDGAQVRDKRKIHDFLHGAGGKHGKTGLAGTHYVTVIAEDGKRVRRKRACAHMEHARQKLAGNFVHVGNHEEQALRGGERGGQRARRKGTVHGTRRAAFRLHFSNADLLAEQVGSAVGRPLIGYLGHG